MIDLGLTKDDRDMIRRSREKVGYVGVVEFVGPRGGRYRSIRTRCCVLEEAARRETDKILDRRWKPAPSGARIYMVDVSGEVIADEAA